MENIISEKFNLNKDKPILNISSSGISETNEAQYGSEDRIYKKNIVKK